MAFNFPRNSRKISIPFILTLLFLIYALNSALAASGGVMGGSSFSSSSDSDSKESNFDFDSRYTTAYPHSYSRSRYDDDNRAAAISEGGGGGSLLRVVLIFGGFVAFVRFVFGPFGSDRKSVVLFLQVALMDEARSIQKDLDQVAFTADASTVKGFCAILKETIVSLLQHPTQCVSGYSFTEEVRNVASLEKRFNQLSLEEREKFDVETLVNLNNIKAQRSTTRNLTNPTKNIQWNLFGLNWIASYMVTILVAAEGSHKLPPIADVESLKEALRCLDSITTSQIKAVQVLWTPQNVNDSLSKEELSENYPLLRSVL